MLQMMKENYGKCEKQLELKIEISFFFLKISTGEPSIIARRTNRAAIEIGRNRC